MSEAYPVRSFVNFQLSVHQRLSEIGKPCSIPVGIFLVIDKDHGGDATAEELVRRFKLIDMESRGIIDFYFFGWVKPNEVSSGTPSNAVTELCFDPLSFESCRQGLRSAGVSKFGGNADLILCDASWNQAGGAILHLSQAIRLDLSRLVAEKHYPNLASILQSIIEAAEEVKRSTTDLSCVTPTSDISDKLGIAGAKSSLLNFFLERFGSFVGAKRLAEVTVRNLGRDIGIFAHEEDRK